MPPRTHADLPTFMLDCDHRLKAGQPNPFRRGRCLLTADVIAVRRDDYTITGAYCPDHHPQLDPADWRLYPADQAAYGLLLQTTIREVDRIGFYAGHDEDGVAEDWVLADACDRVKAAAAVMLDGMSKI